VRYFRNTFVVDNDSENFAVPCKTAPSSCESLLSKVAKLFSEELISDRRS
jgi:hypothetical protein